MITLKKLTELNLANPPKWLPDNLQFLVQMGSRKSIDI